MSIGTNGHNTIVMDGKCQPLTARASITRQTLAGQTPFVVMDLSAAYPNAVSALRGFVLIDGRHVLIVDEIVPAARLSFVDWQMHTAAKIELLDSMAALTCTRQSGGAESLRFYLRIVDPEGAIWSLGSATPWEPQGQNPNLGISKLILRFDQVAQPVRLAVLLSPDSNGPELPFALRRPLSDWIESIS